MIDCESQCTFQKCFGMRKLYVVRVRQGVMNTERWSTTGNKEKISIFVHQRIYREMKTQLLSNLTAIQVCHGSSTLSEAPDALSAVWNCRAQCFEGIRNRSVFRWVKRGLVSLERDRDTTNAAATVVEELVGEARPLGIALHSTTSESSVEGSWDRKVHALDRIRYRSVLWWSRAFSARRWWHSQCRRCSSRKACLWRSASWNRKAQYHDETWIRGASWWSLALVGQSKRH